MAWTTPTPWTDNQLVTAAILNQQVKDNLNALKDPPGNGIQLGSDLTTTSATFVDVTGASVSLTTAGGEIMAWFVCGLYGTTAAVGTLRFMLDGAPTSQLAVQAVGNGSGTSEMVTICARMVATAGSHTVKVQWMVSAGTLTMPNASAIGGQLIVSEIT